MNVFVIGLGSMGKRRIAILRKFSFGIIGIDHNHERCKEVNERYNIETRDSLDDCYVNNGDCAFVCTSPLSHNTIIHNCLIRGLHVFTEINLVSDGYTDNIQLAKEKNLVLFLSSTFLYRNETQYMIERVRTAKRPVSYIYHVGQYLPDWHPWESYQSFFVGNKKTNGCREIFAIELPWIVSCFGKIKSVIVKKQKLSNLQLKYDDAYLVMLQHENGTNGIMAVDVVSRNAVRKIEVYGEDIYLTWSGVPDTVFDYDINEKILRNIEFEMSEHKEGYAEFVSENPYREEVRAFMDCIVNPSKTSKWSFEKDLEILGIIDRIEA